jgi:putative SOS response-associated peptidase YedK
MCAQYTPARAASIAARFGVVPERDDYVALAFPGHVAPILRADPSATLHCNLAVFGLIPHWSKDGLNFRHCYNARSETVAEKPSFRQAWARRQWCAVPADSFYEPSYESGRAVRWQISAREAPLLMAGLWDRWRAPDGRSVLSFTLLTRNADEHSLMRRFHRPEDEKRSVILLAPQELQSWFDCSPTEAPGWMRPLQTDWVAAEAAPQPRR